MPLKFRGAPPHGLQGEDISLLARMGAIGDVYDAITSNRPYKARWDPAESVRRMTSRKGHYVFCYAVGLDMTRRDLQAAAKAKGQPWDMAKGFDHSAPVSAVTPVSDAGVIACGRIELRVNAELRQGGDVSDMIWSIPEIVHELSTLVELQPGDLIFTGTPSGVDPVVKGDQLEATVAGLQPLTVTIG